MSIITTSPDKWKILKTFARENRHEQAKAEKVFWDLVRNNRLGFKFRRQHAIDIFIVDFLCIKQKLIIEIDGETHKYQKEYDDLRTELLNELGYKVIRFSNEEVLGNANMLEKKLVSILNEISNSN